MLRILSRHLGPGKAAKLRQAPAATLTTVSSPASPTGGNFDPYEYTSGCWLRDDAVQRRARKIDFNFDALCQKAVQSCLGAKEILQCDKVEGNSNRAFIFNLDNGATVVARVPFSVAGPARLVTNSEVATLAYSKCLDVPAHRRDFNHFQYGGIPQSLSRRCWTGAMTQVIQRPPSTSSWNTFRACSSQPFGVR